MLVVILRIVATSLSIMSIVNNFVAQFPAWKKAKLVCFA